MDSELATLREELRATQYWLRVLYGRLAALDGDPAGEAAEIRNLIVGLKNLPPPTGMNPALYDQVSLQRLPHIESIGNDIAAHLEQPSSPSDSSAQGD